MGDNGNDMEAILYLMDALGTTVRLPFGTYSAVVILLPPHAHHLGCGLGLI